MQKEARLAIMKRIRMALVFLGYVTVSLSSGHAQTDSGTVRGTVFDSSGASVNTAEITLTNKDSGQTRTVKVDSAGRFSFDVVQRGDYIAHVQSSGFESQDEPFRLQVSQTQTLKFVIQPGAVSDTITVTDAAPVVDTSTSSTGLVVEGEQLRDLPLNGRNFTQLALLTPGVTRGSYGSAASGSGGNAETFRFGDTGGAALSVNGLRQQANNFELDGLNNNELLVGTIVFFPPVEATQEFRITTSVSPAEFGGAGGAIIQSSIKSGTNKIHGSAFFFDRDQIFDANPTYTFGNPAYYLPPPSFHRTQFGGTLGGHILKDRLFAFADYQGLRQKQPQGRTLATLPTAKMRTGDFSELLGVSNSARPVNTFYVPACGNNPPAAPGGSIFNPVNCQPWNYMGHPNVIDPAQISKAGQNYLNAFPLPNVTNPDGTAAIYNNFSVNPPQVQRFDDFDVRLDGTITAKDTAFVRYSYGQDTLQIGSIFPNLPAGFAAGYNPTHPRGVAFGETHIFTPTVINELRLGYTRPYYAYINPLNNVAVSTNLGIPQSNSLPLEGGLANISGGFATTGDSGQYQVPQRTLQLADNVTTVKGSHTIKFGTDLEAHQVRYFQVPCAKGCFNYSSDFTGFAGADILTGFADSYTKGTGLGLGYLDTRNTQQGYYGQDTWRVSKRLTLNLGLRYEMFSYPTETHNYFSNFDIQSQSIQEAGVNGNSRSLINNNYTDFGPRAGFALDLTGNGKASLRGGYGLYYFQERGGGGSGLFNNADFDGSISVFAYQGSRVTLSGETPICPTGTVATASCNPAPTAPYLYNNNAAAATGSFVLPAVNLAHPTGVNLISQNPNSPTTQVQQVNLQFQKQIDQATSFTIAYVGTKSNHLLTSYNLNQQELAANYNQFAFADLNPSINRLDNVGVSNSNALEVSANRNFSRGWQFSASYTWSHALDDSNGTFFTGTNNGGNRIEITNGVANINGPSGNYGNSDQDIRQSFTFGSLYYLPIGRGQLFGSHLRPVLNSILGGYQINAVVVLQSGSPFDVTTGKGTLPNGTSTFAVPGERIDKVGPIRYTKSVYQWFDLSSFAPPPALFTPTNSTYPVFQRQGTLGRNQLFGPAYRTLDMSFFRYFQLTEKVKTQFRVEAYNLTNTPQFRNPNGEVDSGFNIPTPGLDNGNAGQISGTRLHSERQVQLAFHLEF